MKEIHIPPAGHSDDTMLLMCRSQLLVEVKKTLRHQVTIEYNATATYTTRTRSRTHLLTVAWDSLQTRVMTCIHLQIKLCKRCMSI